MARILSIINEQNNSKRMNERESNTMIEWMCAFEGRGRGFCKFHKQITANNQAIKKKRRFNINLRFEFTEIYTQLHEV